MLAVLHLANFPGLENFIRRGTTTSPWPSPLFPRARISPCLQRARLVGFQFKAAFRPFLRRQHRITCWGECCSSAYFPAISSWWAKCLPVPRRRV